MRGSLAKALRRTVERSAPRNLSAVPLYAEVPRTRRVKGFPVPQLQADGTIQIVKVSVPTVTFRLAPDCTRYFTQKFKRTVIRNLRRTMQ